MKDSQEVTGTPGEKAGYLLNDVLIVGGGPAGNQAALSLSRQGYSVVVVDHRVRLGDKLCTGIVGRECAERYRVSAELVRLRARAATIVSPTGRAVVIERSEDQAYVIDRVRFVSSIAGAAMAAGADYRLGGRVAALAIDDSGVHATVISDGRTSIVRARSVIIATGFGSALPRSVGLEAAGTPTFAAQTTIKCTDIESVQVYAQWSLPQGFFGWVVPTLPGEALAGVIGRRRPKSALNSMLEGLKDQGVQFEISGPVRSWGVPLKPAARSYGERVLLVGDVAGQVKPTTGGGIYYAMRCADIAGEVLGAALASGDLTSDALRPYEERWQLLLGRELKLGYFARRIYEQLGVRELDSLLALTATNGLLKDGVKFDWHSDIVSRALGYRLFEGILSPFTRMGRRVGVGADD